MRHAVYFAPAQSHPLWAAGCAWLGRAPDGRSAGPGPAHPLRQAPWRYGFHATLKAPMALADGVLEPEWLAAVKAVAQRHRRFLMPALEVSMLADFVALRPALPLEADHPLRRLADDCVLWLDRWRAALPGSTPARPGDEALSPRQREHAARLGYPHVLEDWRFHMTLSDRLTGVDAPGADALQSAARRHFAAALALPLPCEDLCVFVEPARGMPFELRHRVALAP